MHNWSDCVESRDSVAHGFVFERVSCRADCLFFVSVLYTEHVTIGFTVSICPNVVNLGYFLFSFLT